MSATHNPYTTKTEALARIRQMIEANNVSGRNYDLEAVLDETFTHDEDTGYVLTVTPHDFWDSVDANYHEVGPDVETGPIFNIDMDSWRRTQPGYSARQIYSDNPDEFTRIEEHPHTGAIALVRHDGHALVINPPGLRNLLDVTPHTWDETTRAWVEGTTTSHHPKNEAKAINHWRTSLNH